MKTIRMLNCWVFSLIKNFFGIRILNICLVIYFYFISSELSKFGTDKVCSMRIVSIFTNIFRMGFYYRVTNLTQSTHFANECSHIVYGFGSQRFAWGLFWDSQHYDYQDCIIFNCLVCIREIFNMHPPRSATVIFTIQETYT